MQSSAPATPPGIQLSVVVPTYNEGPNVGRLLKNLDPVLQGIRWELIFVDDSSPDGTAEAVRALARLDPRVRLIFRHNRRGLSSAVVEGTLAAAGEVVAVMDGDLQHEEGVLPRMYEAVSSGRTEIASASRFLNEDGAAGLSSQTRLKISNTGIRLANSAFGLALSDPLTGFFVMRRDVLLRALPALSERGFKILLDIIASARPRPTVLEFPFRFRQRLHGDSKLDNRVIYDFFLFFLEKKIGRVLRLPAQFLSFALINGMGILVHLAVLMIAVSLIGVGFSLSQLIATLVAMFFNFFLNNLITYHDRRLRGTDFFIGFLLFTALCSIGVFANVGVATMLHREHAQLSYIIPAIAGAMITVVWNYVATMMFVWDGRKLHKNFNTGRPQALKNR
jgi:dolichol-phosphate mannosyltransferase